MSKWTAANSEPITVEREIKVREVDGDREGYAKISTTSPGINHLWGVVYRLTGKTVDDGINEPYAEAEILDRHPQFV